jgi:hypothetical protein
MLEKRRTAALFSRAVISFGHVVQSLSLEVFEWGKPKMTMGYDDKLAGAAGAAAHMTMPRTARDASRPLPHRASLSPLLPL